ncbi:MAG: hypothetical protein ACRELU_14480 [Gemmatimonadota bacterium]
MTRIVILPLVLVISIPAAVFAQERVLRDKGVIAASTSGGFAWFFYGCEITAIE